jgi:hypothetical protein
MPLDKKRRFGCHLQKKIYICSQIQCIIKKLRSVVQKSELQKPLSFLQQQPSHYAIYMAQCAKVNCQISTFLCTVTLLIHFEIWQQIIITRA